MEILHQEVNSLLQKGALEPMPPQYQGNGASSPYFLVPKKSNGWRLILDLCQLNVFIWKLNFLMITLASIIPSPQHGHLFSYRYPPSHRRFLRFLMGQDHFQFRVLPFSLAMSPRAFSKVLSVVAAWMRWNGFTVFLYPSQKASQQQHSYSTFPGNFRQQ